MQHFKFFLFVSARCSTCFRRYHRPSSGALNCTIRLHVFVKPKLLPAAIVDELELHWSSISSTITGGRSFGLTNTWSCVVQFSAPDDGRRYRLKHVEHLAETNKKLWSVASCWLYFRNIIAMHGPMNVKPLCTSFLGLKSWHFTNQIIHIVIWKVKQKLNSTLTLIYV